MNLTSPINNPLNTKLATQLGYRFTWKNGWVSKKSIYSQYFALPNFNGDLNALIKECDRFNITPEDLGLTVNEAWDASMVSKKLSKFLKKEGSK